MAKKKNLIYEVGDHFYEAPTLGGKVIAAVADSDRQYLLVHRDDDEENNDVFAVYYQDLRHKVQPALTRRWPGAILEQMLEILRDYRKTYKPKRRRKPVAVQPDPVDECPEDGDAVGSPAESDPPSAPAPPRRISRGDIGLCL